MIVSGKMDERLVGVRALLLRDAMILNSVKDCQRDKVVKNSERLLTEEDDRGTPDEWILDSGRGSLARFYEGQTVEHESLPHFSFLLFEAKLTFWNLWLPLDVRFQLICLFQFV